MSTNVDGGAVGAILGGGLEGRDRTGQRSQTYELAEQLLRHLHADGVRGQVRLALVLDDASWAKYRSEVQRPFRAEPRVTVVPVDGVGMLEFRRAEPLERGDGPEELAAELTRIGVEVRLQDGRLQARRFRADAPSDRAWEGACSTPPKSWSEGGPLCPQCSEIDCNGRECEDGA